MRRRQIYLFPRPMTPPPAQDAGTSPFEWGGAGFKNKRKDSRAASDRLEPLLRFQAIGNALIEALRLLHIPSD